MSDMFEKAWPLVKMPIVDTKVPGLKVAYGFDKPVRDLHEYNVNAGKNKKWKAGPELIGETDNQGSGEMVQMTADEYFDRLAEVGIQRTFGENLYPKGRDDGWWNEIPEKYRTLESMRHPFGMKSPPGDGAVMVDRIIEGIKEGKIMGAPEIDMAGDTPTGFQDGGHRMDALRRLGFGDIPIPVSITRQTEDDK